jgi:hypothetical protein
MPRLLVIIPSNASQTCCVTFILYVSAMSKSIKKWIVEHAFAMESLLDACIHYKTLNPQSSALEIHRTSPPLANRSREIQKPVACLIYSQISDFSPSRNRRSKRGCSFYLHPTTVKC